MPRLRLPGALALGCYVLALLQRPGRAVSDTKIDLHADPVRFLADAFAPWTSDISLGHVQSGQYGGYVFPQGPFFALGHVVGLAPWLVERLWLGTLYALAAWGVVRLLDALLERERGVAHVVAAGAFVLNPYVVTYTSRVSVSLLAYAALPWLLLFVQRGVRSPRGWLWPAAFALVVTSSGGGINAAVTAWALVGPLLLLVYEPFAGLVGWRDVRAFVWRTALLGLVTSLWWVVPLLVQAKWGLPFLPYTEQPGTIWGTTSATESLRLLGFWLTYAGTGYGGRLSPYTSDARVLLFSWPVLVGSLLVPAGALGGYAWTRRWRYGPFFLLLTLVGVIVMIAGFPEGTPLRSGMTFAYNRLVSLQFLRTTYKAGPLPALGLAVLLGAAAREAWARRPQRVPLGALRVVIAGGAALLLALSAWPLVRGRGVEDAITFDHVPAAWTDTAHTLDRSLGDDARAMVLPGQLFSYYRWGGTIDPILPTLAKKPVAVRQVVPFADLRSVGLQWGTDALVSQRRAFPGQLAPLLALQAVGAVVTGSDDDRARSGALGANEAARTLAEQGFAVPPAADLQARETDQLGVSPDSRRPGTPTVHGPDRTVAPQAGELATPVRLPEVSVAPTGDTGLVRLQPRVAPTVVDGDAQGILDLAAFGPLPAASALRYAADMTPDDLRTAARQGGRIVITDSDRRQVFVPSRLLGNVGPVLGPTDPISEDGHQLDPFDTRGTDTQTVAAIGGARWVRAPASPQITQFPEHRPFAAVDGDPRTAWLADRTLDADRWHLDLKLLAKRDVPYLDLLPYGDARGRVKAVRVNGHRFKVHPGWNRLAVRLHHVDVVSVLMADVTNPAAGISGGAGGISELRVPGVHVTEALRPPTDAARALRGADLRHTPLTFVLERTRGDDPFHRGTVHGPWQAGEVRDRGDAETGLQRDLDLPAPRAWTATGWATIAPDAPDSVFDSLAGSVPKGTPGVGFGTLRVASSSRFEGLGRYRGSSALDGNRSTAWIAGWIPGQASPRGGAPAWLGWRTATSRTVRSFTIVPVAARVRRPVRVRLDADGRIGAPVTVGPGGRVTLPTPVRGRTFRLSVLTAAFPKGTPGPERQRRAMGIAELRGAGIPVVHPRRSGALRATCSVRVRLGTAALRLRPEGTIADLDAGRPLRARLCGAAAPLPAGAAHLSAPGDGPFRLDLLRLDAPAPVPLARAAASSGRVLDPGDPGRGHRGGVRLSVHAPSWLVLGESYSAGWRASCDGKDLGAPVPLDGYANGWPVEPGCEHASFTFAGNRLVLGSAIVSLLGALALLGIVALGLRATPARANRGSDLQTGPTYATRGQTSPLLADPPPEAWPLRRALAAGVAALLVGGFVFAVRAGVLIGPAVFLILWKAVDARRLALAAGALLGVVVPVLYLAVPVHDKGGFNTNLPLDRISAHWVGVAAIILLLAALIRSLVALRPR